MKLKEGMIVHCDTGEKARIFLEECKKQGFHDSYYDEYTDWEAFNENMCYRICNEYTIWHSDKEFYMGEGYKIIDFDDLFKMDSKLKVGDKVKIKNNLIEYETYGKYGFVPRMSIYKNKGAMITEIEEDYISIDLDNGRWAWSKEMLEKVEEEKKMSKCKVYEMPDYVGNEVKKVIINEPCVIVILNSGEKGVAKCCPEDVFNEERGYILALERARKEKYLNDVVRQDEVINQCLKIFDNDDMIKNYNKMISEFYHTK